MIDTLPKSVFCIAEIWYSTSYIYDLCMFVCMYMYTCIHTIIKTSPSCQPKISTGNYSLHVFPPKWLEVIVKRKLYL